MMAARPTTNSRTTTAVPARPAGSAAPQVRDFASPSSGFAIEWDVRPVYDFLFSLGGEGLKAADLSEADRAWLEEARGRLPDAVRPDYEAMFGAEMGIYVAAVAVERRDLQTVDAFVAEMQRIPTDELLQAVLCDLQRDPELGDLVTRSIGGDAAALEALREALPDHKNAIQMLLSEPAETHQRIVRVLEAWAGIFAEIEPHVRAIIERDHALRAGDRGTYAGSDLIERTTGGIRWLPEVGIKRVILAPSYFSRPYNYLLAGDDWRFFGYPVADEALEAADRLAPPASVVRLHRALGDETRLRILKLLVGQDLYLTEIAQQLDLSKPTIKHHLAQLRAAGLVTVVEAGSVIYYTLRRDRIAAASAELERFLSV
jgi:DNA-binding transcriptional ArsR family regulator